VVDIGAARLGLSICYDLRFPQLYRALAQAGAQVLAIPSAFMKASVTSLPTSTSRNGPNGLAAGSPKISLKNCAAASRSPEWTMVWFSLIVMPLRA